MSDGEKERERERQTDRQTETETDRDRETERQRQRQRQRQTQSAGEKGRRQLRLNFYEKNTVKAFFHSFLLSTSMAQHRKYSPNE